MIVAMAEWRERRRKQAYGRRESRWRRELRELFKALGGVIVATALGLAIATVAFVVWAH